MIAAQDDWNDSVDSAITEFEYFKSQVRDRIKRRNQFRFVRIAGRACPKYGDAGRRPLSFQNPESPTAHCRRPIKMSLLRQLQMTLPGGFPGGVGGDDSADERWGADAARGAAGFGSAAIDDSDSNAAAGARAATGVPAVEGLPQRGSGWFDFEAPRSLQQSSQAGGSSQQGAVDHSRALLGFRPNFGGREAARSA